MDNERWLPVKGYEGLYEVSEYGNVKSLERMEWRNSKKESKRIRREKIMSPYEDRDGYLRLNLSNGSESKTKFCHRLVAEAFLENKENLPEVNHKNKPKSNNHYSNLEWCTGEYNRQHAIDNKLCMQSDESAYASKLTNEQVLTIRSMHKTGQYSSRKLAKVFNVTKSTILRAVNNKTFRLVL